MSEFAQNTAAVAALVLPLTFFLLVAFNVNFREWASRVKNFLLSHGDSKIKLEMHPERNVETIEEIHGDGYGATEPPPEDSEDENENEGELEQVSNAPFWETFGKACRANDFEDAEVILEQRVSEIESESDKTWRRALCYSFMLNQGYSNGYTKLKELAESHPEERVVQSLLGDTMELRDDFVGALKLYETQEKKSGADEYGYVAGSAVDVARCLAELGRTEEAKEKLLRTLARIPEEEKYTRSQIYKGLSAFYDKIGDSDNSILALHMAAEYSPEDDDLCFQAAYKYDDANELNLLMNMALYRKVLKLKNSANMARNNLGVIYDKLELKNHSAACYKRAVSEGNTLAAANLAQRLYDKGLLEEAKEILQTAKENEKYHENVDRALVDIANSTRREADSLEKLDEVARQRAKYLVEFGKKYFNAEESEQSFEGTWESDSGQVFNIKLTDNQLYAEHYREEVTRPVFLTGTVNRTTKHTITWRGEVCNCAARITVNREVDPPTTPSIFDSVDATRKRAHYVYLSDDKIRFMEVTEKENVFRAFSRQS